MNCDNMPKLVLDSSPIGGIKKEKPRKRWNENLEEDLRRNEIEIVRKKQGTEDGVSLHV